MAKTTKSIQIEAYKLIFGQLAVIMGLALILLLLQGIQSSLSALLGGLAYVLPNFLFVWRVFSRTDAKDANRFLVAFVFGEAGKLFISAILFVLIVKYLPIKLMSVLGGFITAIVAFWVVAFISMSQEPRGEGHQ